MWHRNLLLLSLLMAPGAAHGGSCDEGIAAYEVRDFDLAVTAITVCLSDDNAQDAELIYKRGRSFMKLAQFEKAVADFKAVTALDQTHAGPWNSRAWVSYIQQDHPTALKLAERALELAPENPRVLDTYAHILAANGDANGALAFFEKGIMYQSPAAIAKIQSNLRAQGIDPGPVDGLHGAKTRNALAQCARDACNIWQ